MVLMVRRHRAPGELRSQPHVLQRNLWTQENPAWLARSRKQLSLHWKNLLYHLSHYCTTWRLGLFLIPQWRKKSPARCSAVLACTHSPAQANTEEKILLPLKDELPPRHLTFTTQESFHLDRDQSSPHTVAQCPAVTGCTPTLVINWGSCHRDKSKATRWQ